MTIAERIAALEQTAKERKAFVADMRADFARMNRELDTLESRIKAIRENK